jgi:SAM-dependent methyltransferase
MERDEKALWNCKYRERSHISLKPDPLLVSAYSEFFSGEEPGKALDVAGGVGRHSIWLAERGWKVTLVDVSEVGIELAAKNLEKRRLQQRVTLKVRDLQTTSSLGSGEYDLVLVFFYLQRELFPALIKALKPGGFLIYKTYTMEQRRFAGGPSHPMHLLKPNELLKAFASLQVLHYHETVQEKGVAELVARRR